MNHKILLDEAVMVKTAECLVEEAGNLHNVWLKLYEKNFTVLQEWSGSAAEVFAQAAGECEMRIQEAAEKAAESGNLLTLAAKQRGQIDAETAERAQAGRGTTAVCLQEGGKYGM